MSFRDRSYSYQSVFGGLGRKNLFISKTLPSLLFIQRTSFFIATSLTQDTTSNSQQDIRSTLEIISSIIREHALIPDISFPCVHQSSITLGHLSNPTKVIRLFILELKLVSKKKARIWTIVLNCREISYGTISLILPLSQISSCKHL